MIDDFIPDVEFEARCPICDDVLIHDYFWICNGCELVWEPDGSEGRAIEQGDEFSSFDDEDYGI